MSCILRISGEFLNIEALLSEHDLVPDRIWKQGDATIRFGLVHSDSGANFLASDQDLDEFDCQVKEAAEFLERHSLVIAKMVAFPDVQRAVLDFGVSLPEGFVSHCCHFPPRFIQLAASAGLALEISHYLCSPDEKS